MNVDDINKQKDQQRVIEQFFPEPSTLGPPLLLPNLAEDDKRLLVEVNFAKEQNIEEHDRDHRREVRRQTKKYDDIIEEESIKSETKTEEEQSSMLEVPSNEKDVPIEQDEVYIDDQLTDISQSKLIEEPVEKRLSEIASSPQSSEEDQTIKDELRKPSIKTLTSDEITESSLSIAKVIPSLIESSLSKSTTINLPNNTEDLTTGLTGS